VTRALWYRHWLDLRSGFYASVVFVGLMAVGYAVAVYGVLDFYGDTGRYAREVMQYRPILESAPERLIPWILHAQFMTLFALLAPLMLHGSGYASQQRRGVVGADHPSVGFTLTLPVSRFKMVKTRLGAGAAALAALLTASLAGHVVALLVLGKPIAAGPMTATTVLAIVLGVTVLTTITLLGVLAQGQWLGKAMVPVQLFLWFGAWPMTITFLAGERVLATLSGLLAASAVAFGLTVAVAARREF
jgi:hypothetical protein